MPIRPGNRRRRSTHHRELPPAGGADVQTFSTASAHLVAEDHVVEDAALRAACAEACCLAHPVHGAIGCGGFNERPTGGAA
jgi:hypothetical protein